MGIKAPAVARRHDEVQKNGQMTAFAGASNLRDC